MRKILFILSLAVGLSCVEARPALGFFQKMMLWKKGGSVVYYKDPVAVQEAFSLLYLKYDANADTVAKEISEYFRKDPRMQVALAKAYVSNRENEKAKTYLAKALKRNKNYVPAYILWGDMYGVIETGYILPDSARDSALVWYEKAIKADKKDASGYVRCAKVLAKTHNLDGAKEILDKLHAVRPDYPCEAEYAALVINYDPNNRDAKKGAINSTDPYKLGFSELYKYSNELFRANDFANSLKFAKIGLERFPGHESKYFSEMCLWSAFETGDYSTAREQGRRWIENTRRDSISSVDLFYMGASEIALGNINEGFNCFSHIAETHDEFSDQMDGRIKNLMAKQVEVKRDAKDFSGAIAMYKRFIEKYPSKTDPAYQLYMLAGIFKSKLRCDENHADSISDADNAIRYYQEILERYPHWENIHVIYYNYADMITRYVDLHNAQGTAIPYYIKYYNIIDRKPDATAFEKNQAEIAAYYIAWYYWKVKNDNSKALLWFNNELKYNPTDEQIRGYVELLSKVVRRKR